MNHESALGFAHFLSQADGIAKGILLIMLVMSVTTWYLIFTKSIRNIITAQKSRAFLKMFWDAPNVAAVAAHLQSQEQRGGPLQEPFSELVRQGLVAAEQHRTRSSCTSTAASAPGCPARCGPACGSR